MFFWILFDLLREGIQNISFSFLYETPKDAGRSGGVASILVATFEIVAVCMVVAVPIGLGTAVLLAEYSDEKHRFGRLVRRSLDILASVPSIVFGLFGSAFFCIYLGMGFSILAGGLTLACMVLPIFIRTAEEGFRAVPQAYRLGAASLGISRTSTLFKVLLPSALPALSAGFVLGVGRAMAETAALIFTSGYVSRMPESLFDSGRAMSVHIYDLAMNVPGGNPNAYATALVLVSILLLINGSAAWIAQHWLSRGATKS
jgi:phosphate transport system permease protein